MVNEVFIDKINLSDYTLDLMPGDRYNITTEIQPSNATEEIEWSLGGDKVIRVSQKGDVTALNEPGVSVITAKSKNAQARCIALVGRESGGFTRDLLIDYVTAMGATYSKNGDITTVEYNGIKRNFRGTDNTHVTDKELNKLFGWKYSWIPNGQLQAAYAGVHSVLGTPFHHTSTIIFAAPDSIYYNTIDFEKNKSDERNVRYATIGAGSPATTLITGGMQLLLVSDKNRKDDVKLNIKKRIIGLGIHDIHTINSLFKNEEYYRKNYNNLSYTFFPDYSETNYYNSNSFTRGLLIATGIKITFYLDNSDVPGWLKPLNPRYFGVDIASIAS